MTDDSHDIHQLAGRHAPVTMLGAGSLSRLIEDLDALEFSSVAPIAGEVFRHKKIGNEHFLLISSVFYDDDAYAWFVDLIIQLGSTGERLARGCFQEHSKTASEVFDVAKSNLLHYLQHSSIFT